MTIGAAVPLNMPECLLAVDEIRYTHSLPIDPAVGLQRWCVKNVM